MKFKMLKYLKGYIQYQEKSNYFLLILSEIRKKLIIINLI